MKKLLLFLITLAIIASIGCIMEPPDVPEFAITVTTLKGNTYELVEDATVQIEGREDVERPYVYFTNKNGKVVITTKDAKYANAVVTVKKEGCNTFSKEYKVEYGKMIAINIVCQ